MDILDIIFANERSELCLDQEHTQQADTQTICQNPKKLQLEVWKDLDCHTSSGHTTLNTTPG